MVDPDSFSFPNINSPYDYPGRHWDLDEPGQPTNSLVERRRLAKFISPIPKPKKRRGEAQQASMVFDAEAAEISTKSQRYDPTPIINSLRENVEKWRQISNPVIGQSR